MRVKPVDFQRLNLRCHALLSDVPLHDVWAIRLEGGGPGRGIQDARAILFDKYAYDHRMTVFGEVSQELRELGNKHAGGVAVYSFLQGLQTAAAV